MKLIVGLGNPGKEYSNTRHNMGFNVIDMFANVNNVVIDKSKFNGLYNVINIENEKVMLLKPMNYINLSGDVINRFISYFDINLDDVLIISDDLDMEFGKIKLKSHGSSGGHNGLKNIENQLGTKDYKRLKIGIGKNNNMDTRDYVTGKLSKDESEKFAEILPICCKILDDFIHIDFINLMNKYN